MRLYCDAGRASEFQETGEFPSRKLGLLLYNDLLLHELRNENDTLQALRRDALATSPQHFPCYNFLRDIRYKGLMSEASRGAAGATPGGKRVVHVVLPVYNEAPRIERLLNHVDEALEEAAIPYRVILVDDGSRDATREIVRECANRMPI